MNLRLLVLEDLHDILQTTEAIKGMAFARCLALSLQTLLLRYSVITLLPDKDPELRSKQWGVMLGLHDAFIETLCQVAKLNAEEEEEIAAQTAKLMQRVIDQAKVSENGKTP